eukprot:TRINITY_DN25730_c0_g1_i1.p1 TRINITY_DN25730_c0_g1~~TRINITY_DN25730_c0_g1_i1.p1  ORF type:complete len:157 (+),score=58.70 TRINITY_DN25730_c0_g1_i1:22-471(+)
MELMSTIATLDSHYLVLDSELKEVNKDCQYLRGLTKRYGAHWDKALKQLRSIKTQKEHARKEVTMNLDLFKLHLPAAKALCKKLQRNGCNLTVEKVENGAPDFVLTVDSPILANSSSPAVQADPLSSTVTLYKIPHDDPAAMPPHITER